MSALSARQEWRSMWPLPLVSMAGVSGGAMFAYSSGVFMEELTTTFGWTRTQYSSAFLLQMVLGLFILPSVGWLTDRFGPRRVVLFGLMIFPLAFSTLGLVGRPIWQWWAYCIVVALGQGFIAQTVWITAVVGRFEASRGLAMAIALGGLGVGSLIWPPLAAAYIEIFGWRLAFAALAFSWVAIVLPLALLFFHGSPRPAAGDRIKAPRTAYALALKSRTFVGLIIAGGLFSSAYFGAAVHLVPILRSNGLPLTTAAGIAGLLGLFSIAGRLITGQLLDRFPTRPVAVAVFLLPAAASALLWYAQQSVPISLVAIGLLGLSAGAEMDVITFVAARRFGQQVFASVYSIFTAILALCASSGPLIAGVFFDASGSYGAFLMAIIPMVLLGSVTMAWIPIDPAEDVA